MIIFKHEMKRGRRALFIWSVAISAFVVISLMLYPKIERNMKLVNSILTNFQFLTAAFGMFNTDYVSMISYYGIEAGAFLGLGGGLFAATTGAAMLAKEEGRHTAEFLMPHPISRFSVITQKLLALLVQVIILNLFVSGVSLLAAQIVKRPFPMDQFAQLHFALLLLTIQLGLMVFGLSAFMKKDNPVVGIAVTLAFYFTNIFININRETALFKYITPYFYADGSRVIDGAMPWDVISISYAAAAVILMAGYIKYIRKDLAI